MPASLPAPPKPPLVSIVRAMFTAFGAMAFLVTNAMLYVGRCTSTEFMFNCRGATGEATSEVLIIAAIVLISGLLWRRGRAFAQGFFGALAGLALVTTGACTPAWMDPYASIKRRVDPIQRRASEALENDRRRREWIEAINAKPMDVARGVELAGTIVSCVQGYAAANGRVPADAAELSSGCQAMADFGDGAKPDERRLYTVPIPPGTTDTFGDPITPERGDPGWRAIYERVGTAFRVRVVPDGWVKHAWPRITSDETRRMTVTPYQQEPVDVTPIAELRILASCLKGIPAAVEQRTAKTGGVSYGWALTSMTRKVCPDLAARVHAPTDNDSNVTRLTLLMPSQGAPAMPAAVFVIRFEQTSAPAQPFAFTLHAEGAWAGLRRYLLTPDGTIHWTSDPRPATPSDPVHDR